MLKLVILSFVWYWPWRRPALPDSLVPTRSKSSDWQRVFVGDTEGAPQRLKGTAVL